MADQDEDRIEVSEERLGDLLIQGLEEALAIRRGEKKPARRVRRLDAEADRAVSELVAQAQELRMGYE